MADIPPEYELSTVVDKNIPDPLETELKRIQALFKTRAVDRKTNGDAKGVGYRGALTKLIMSHLVHNGSAFFASYTSGDDITIIQPSGRSVLPFNSMTDEKNYFYDFYIIKVLDLTVTIPDLTPAQLRDIIHLINEKLAPPVKAKESSTCVIQ